MELISPWTPEYTGSGVVYRPLLRAYVICADAQISFRDFLVDSGADISMAPRQLATELGLNWTAGEKKTLTGISKRKECRVNARVLQVQLFIRELKQELAIPMCFANADVPCLLAREGFFDVFQVLFDKRTRRTVIRSF